MLHSPIFRKMPMKKVPSLLDLAKRKAWVVDASSCRADAIQINPDDIWVKSSSAREGIVKKIVIRMGLGVLKKLGAAIGDRISIFYHPDDLMSFMLVKSQAGKGFKASLEYRSKTVVRLQVTWKRPIVLESIPATRVDYLHIRETGSIIFRIGATSD